jgi:hypothetical protein
MVSETEEVNLLLLAVPVAPDALKDSRAVVKGMGHNSYLGFREGDKLLLKIGIRRHLILSLLDSVHYNSFSGYKTSRFRSYQSTSPP